MQRTTIYEKNGRIYVQREFQIGDDRWQLITRFAFTSVDNAVTTYPKFFPDVIVSAPQTPAN